MAIGPREPIKEQWKWESLDVHISSWVMGTKMIFFFLILALATSFLWSIYCYSMIICGFCLCVCFVLVVSDAMAAILLRTAFKPECCLMWAQHPEVPGGKDTWATCFVKAKAKVLWVLSSTLRNQQYIFNAKEQGAFNRTEQKQAENTNRSWLLGRSLSRCPQESNSVFSPRSLALIH